MSIGAEVGITAWQSDGSDLCELIVYRWYKRRNNRRREWVHAINQERANRGVVPKLYCELRKDEEKFSNYLRMQTDCFDKLFEHKISQPQPLTIQVRLLHI